MTGLFLCALSGALCFVVGCMSLVRGLQGVLTIGYLFGIARANIEDRFGYFIFDAAVLGFYLSLFINRGGPGNVSFRGHVAVRRWTFVLIGWACIMTAVPMQHVFIQLVGLRGNAFLLPFLLVGAWLTDRDALRLALTVAILNLMALGIAIGEFIYGIETFFPDNAVTELIYRSRDVAERTAYRIPACFSNAHSYASTMWIGVPWLLGAVVRPGLAAEWRAILIAGLVAGLLGVFLSATRIYMPPLLVLVVVASLSRQMSSAVWLLWVCVLGGVTYLVASEERLQRVLSLADTDRVIERVQGSVNKNFFEILVEYPMGNGMGAGGTSIPFFFHRFMSGEQVGLENEYSRILLEQGLIGLALWVGFIAWLMLRPLPWRGPWTLGQRLMWYVVMCGFAIALLGLGLMTSVPFTPLFFLSAGFMCVGRSTPKPAS